MRPLRVAICPSATPRMRRPPYTMAPRYQFELARNPQDDDALRAVVRETSMAGPIELSFRREPDFFRAAGAGNHATTVLLARHRDTGRVVSTATFGLRRAFVDGREQSIGYLNSLRLLPEARGTTVLARGYHYLRRHHSTPYSITTILDGNREARRILASGRAGLPVYCEAGRLHTFLLPLYCRHAAPASAPATRLATSADIPRALDTLNSCNSAYQFAPCYHPNDFVEPSQLLPGLHPGNVRLYQDGRNFLGTFAVWDQSAFKQTVVTGYSGWTRFSRPAITLAARLGLAPPLPAIGHPLSCLYAALLSSRDSDPEVFRRLLQTELAFWSRRGYTYLILGLCDGHPFLPAVEKLSAMTLVSTLYLVYWSDAVPPQLPSACRIRHLEVATL